MSKRDETISALAKFFTGTAVVHHSVGLSVGGVFAKVGQQFFDAREILGVRGYDTEDVAREAIKRNLES